MVVNVRLGSFDDFYKAFINAPQSVKNILSKAYPDYYSQLQNAYNSIFNNKKQITGNEQLKISTNKQTEPATSNTKPNATIKSNPPKFKNISKYGGKILGGLAAINEIPKLLDPNVSNKGKLLSGAGIGAMVTGHPAAGLALMGASSLNENAPTMANKIADNNFNKWDKQYGINSNQYDPRFIKLTPEEIAYGYGNKKDVNNLVSSKNELSQLEQSVAKEQELTNQAEQKLNNTQTALDRYKSLVTSLNPNTTQVTQSINNNNSIRANSVPQEAALNTNQVQTNQPNNQQVLMNPTVSSNELSQSSMENLMGLENMINNNQQQIYTPELNKEWLNRYADLMIQDRENKLAQRQAAIQEYDNIIKRYNQARAADAMGSITPGAGIGPVQFIGPNGQLMTINDPNREERLKAQQANANKNVNNFKNELVLQQLRQKDKRLASNNNNFQKQLLDATVVAERMGISPVEALALGDKLYSTYGDMLINTGKSQNDINKIPYETRGKLIEEQAKASYGMNRDLYNDNRSLAKEQYVQGQLNTRAYNQMVSDIYKFEAEKEAQLNYLRQQGANEKELAEYKNMLEMNSPIKRLQIMGDLAQSGSYYTNPNDYKTNLLQSEQFINDYLELKNNRNLQPIQPNNGTITPNMMRTMLGNTNYGR